ncbi:efflux RND transporter permease subunit [Rubrivirga sp. S365]|uniref:efflux RND transporter permease subunit n=1 Tax=Rubrivirga sp. S365 TaxID=3076080 RepID=UPI0028CA3C90|nr:efflux RND transporter permease subunit [Rubrivirga sp. S365]MDT7857359.1 efflux RND transporter permease subunit [Rubrivirga sp. S365]
MTDQPNDGRPHGDGFSDDPGYHAAEVPAPAAEPDLDEDRYSGLSGVAIRRPVFTSMIMLGLIVLGLFSLRNLPIDQFPDVEIPVVTVTTVYPGASPETIEREVSERLEQAFNPVEGVDGITSISLEGVSQIIVEFDLDRSSDDAANDIRSKIATVRADLPADIEEPLVQTFDPSAQPIVSLAVSSTALPIQDLTSLADEDIRRQLEAVPGVGEVQVAGGLAREIRVNVDPARLQAQGVSVNEVIGALQAQNLEVPAGRVERGTAEQLVRVVGRIEEPDEFNDIVVANRGGTPIRLGDVATVRDATEEERSVALVNGERAVALNILKVSGSNTVDVAEGVRETVAEIQAALPAQTELQVIRDNSVTIEHSVNDTLFELVLGGILTVVIVMLFLNDGKATVITALALPVSVIAAFILMGVLGFTLNIISLLALSLSIGILIDDAIVVIENVVRHREMGKGYFEAAADGTKEIFLAVMATTLSIVAVFVPVAFMGGIVGRFFYQFGLTVAFAVLVSLFVAFTLTPMMAAHWGVDPHVEGGHGAPSKNPLKRAISAFNRWFDRTALRYHGIIEWALRHRKTTVLGATALFVGSLFLFPLIGGSFLPPQDQSQFVVQFETPDGSSLTYTRDKAEQVSRALRSLDGVDYTYTTVGAGQTGTVTSGEVFVSLVGTGERDRTQQEVQAAARETLAPLFGVTTSVLDAGGIGGAVAPLAVEVRGPDVEGLQELAQAVEAEVAALPEVVDVQNSLGQPRPEFRIAVNRNVANELGLTVGGVAGTVRPELAGQEVTTWQDPTGEERDVVVQVAPELRQSVRDIAQIPIATPQGGSVPLEQIAAIEEGTAPSQIDRTDLQRTATISGSPATGLSVSEATQAIQARLDQMDIPAGYTVGFGGETEQLAETGGYVIQAILLAIILIFLILASQFESITQPFAIMMSLPLSLIGVFVALLLTNDTLNMMSMIGVILLFGLVVKNAILLIDNANERRREGVDRFQALAEAGQVRLRPIVMTTLAMIAGMLPSALALGEGGGFRAPMSRAVIGGLITSTILTLIVVPVAYTYFDDLGAWFRGKLGREDPHGDPTTEPSATERPDPALAPVPALD